MLLSILSVKKDLDIESVKSLQFAKFESPFIAINLRAILKIGTLNTNLINICFRQTSVNYIPEYSKSLIWRVDAGGHP